MKRILVLFFLFLVYNALCQVNQTEKIKLCIAFGNNVQMAYDAIDRKYKAFISSTSEALDNADDQFYASNFRRSIDNYFTVIERFVGDGKSSGPIDMFSVSRGRDKRFSKAEKYLRLVGPQQLNREQWLMLADAINNLGIYNQRVGNLAVAEKLFLKALEIRGEQAGKTSEYYVATLNNIAMLRMEQGRYLAAEDMLKYVVSYYKKTRSESSYQYAITSNNLAMLYAKLGRMQEATGMLNKIIDNASINFFPHAIDRARIMTNVALVEMENRNYEKASSLLTQALKMYEDKGLSKHSDVQEIRLHLADVYLLQGKTEALNQLQEEILLAIEAVAGKDNLWYAHALESKGRYLLQKESYAEGIALFQQIANIRSAKLGVLHKDYLRALNRIGVCQWKSGNISGAYNTFSNTTAAYLEVLDKFFYNMSEQEKTKFWQTLKPELDIFYSFMLDQNKAKPEVLQLAYNLRLKTKGLLLHNTNQVRDAIYGQGDKDIIAKYEDWLANKQVLADYFNMDKETITIMGIDLDLLETESNELERELNRLVTGGITGVGHERITFKEVATALQEGEVALEIMRVTNLFNASSADVYVAFVLRKNTTPDLIHIGNARELETKMAAYYKNSVASRIEESLTFQKFWLPIKTAIGEVSKVILSPDGVYNSINVMSLRNEAGQYLIDQVDVQILPNSKQIAIKASEQTPNSTYVLIGNPAFRDATVSSLPGTEKEVAAIRELITDAEISLRTGQEATEKSLKDINKPKVLHIATHGFFLNDVAEASITSSGLMTRSNPLMRSGLLLAGAGNLSGREATEAISDGIFTAYDAMNLKLQNTDLVVLSACETGKGEIVNGEGVYGLTRAFTIAGARHVIMSLWKVDDQATMELMTYFYKEWLATNNLERSFRSAQLSVKKKYSDPYYWAAFVLMSN